MPEIVRVADGSEGLGPERVWSAALDAMELHLDEIRAGIEVGFLPSPYAVAAPESPVPASLKQRALRVLAAQHDLEETLRERMASLASVLSGAFRPGVAPAPVYVDRRG